MRHRITLMLWAAIALLFSSPLGSAALQTDGARTAQEGDVRPGSEPEQAAPDQTAPERGVSTVFVRVVDGRGNPLPNSEVIYAEQRQVDERTRRSESAARKTVDRAGECKLVLRAGCHVKIAAICPRQHSSRAHVEIAAPAAGETSEVELTVLVRPDIEVTATLVDDVTGTPIAGADVIGPMNDTLEGTTTDEQGRFTVRSRSWMPVTYFFNVDGYGKVGMVPEAGMIPEAEDKAPIFRLEKECTVLAQLRNAPAGTAIDLEIRMSGAKRTARQSAADFARANRHWRGRPLRGRLETLDSESGLYAIRGVPCHVATELVARANGRALARYLIPAFDTAGQEQKTILNLATGGAIEGFLTTPNGVPIPAQTIQLSGEKRPVPRTVGDGSGNLIIERAAMQAVTAVTDEAGSFRFDGLLSGSYQLTAKGDVAAESETITVEASEGATDVTLIGRRNLRITGRVLDREGAPIRAQIHLTRIPPPGAAVSRSVTTATSNAETGEFTSGPLLPGLYRATAMTIQFPMANANGAPVSPSYGAAVLATNLILRAGQGDVVLRESAPGSLYVTAKDAAGNDAPALFTVVNTADGTEVQLNASPKSQIVVFQRPIGTYKLYAHTPEGLVSDSYVVDLEEGSRTEIELNVTPGARLAARAEGRTLPLRVEVRSERGHRFSVVVPGPGPTEAVLPTGKLTLTTIEADGTRTERTVNVAPGETVAH